MGFFRRDRTPAVRAEIVERRDPTAATRSLRYLTPGRPQMPDWDAARAFEWAYYANVVVYACVRAIATTISALPFRAGPDPDRPENYNVNAPLARLLGPPPGGPNPSMSAEEWWDFMVTQFLVTGRLGSEIELDAATTRKPVALWPLVSQALVPTPSAQGTAWWSGFEYGSPSDKRGLKPDQVLYVWQPRGSDFRQAESALEAAGIDVSIAVMQSRYDYAFLANDARPAALVVTESFADRDDYDAFKGQWNSEYRGPGNAGKVAFVEADGGDKGVQGAVDVKVLGLSPKDAQAAQRYADRLQQIAIGLGVPWSRLDASGRTFDNASQEDSIWWQQRLLPLIRKLQAAVNMQLAPRVGTEVGWFDLRAVKALQSRPDPVTAAVGAPSLVQAQLMTINEARADYGLAPVTNGDRMMTADEIAALRGGGTPDMPVRALPAPEAREAREPEPALTPMTAPAPAVDHEARRARLWTTTNGKIRNLERQWERALKRLFARQQRQAIARLEARKGRARARGGEVRALADEIFDPQHWALETADDVTALYEAVTAAGGARVSDLFGLAFDLEAEFAQDFVQARSNQLAGQVTDTTYQAIRDALAEGVAEGESIPDLAARVRHVFDVASTSRATMIARTEVVSAFNGSAALTAASYGTDVVAGQEWIATRDARVRDEHAARDGEIVGIGQPFSGGLAYPGDPSGDPADTINCRCTVAFLTPEDMTERTGRSIVIERRVALAAFTAWNPREGAQVVKAAYRKAA